MTDCTMVPGQLDVLPFRRKWLERGLLLAVVLAACLAMSHNTADPDLWGHVTFGRNAIVEGIPATTTFSYTAEGYRWINHENLAEMLFAVVSDWTGGPGLLILKALLAATVLGLIMHYSLRQGLGAVAICLMILLVGINLSRHWAMRPQLLSYTYYGLLLFLLSYSFQGWQGRWHLHLGSRKGANPSEDLFYSDRRLRHLWMAPVLFLFWANSHGGFVAGFLIYAAYLSLRSLEALTCKGRAAWPLISRFAMMIAAAGLTTLINPYGHHLHGWLIESLTIPRPEITEWHPPNLLHMSALPIWLAMGTWAIVMLFTRRSRDFTHLVILTLTLWQSLEHQRHIPFFIIAYAFWMTVHLESTLCRFNISKKDTTFGEGMVRPVRWTLAVGFCLAYGLLIGKLYERLREMPVPRNQFPVSAVNYMASHDLEGRLVVTYNWAQYLIASMGTKDPNEAGIQVGFDGRFRTCYPQRIVDMHFDMVLGDMGLEFRHRSDDSPPPDGAVVLEYSQPDLVLLNRFQPHSELVMYQNRDSWSLLYQDHMSQLWGRSTKYDDPSLATYIEPARRRITMTPQRGSVVWPGFPTGNKNKDAADARTPLARKLPSPLRFLQAMIP